MSINNQDLSIELLSIKEEFTASDVEELDVFEENKENEDKEGNEVYLLTSLEMISFK